MRNTMYPLSVCKQPRLSSKGQFKLVRSCVQQFFVRESDGVNYLYSSAQDGIYALGKANMRSTPSLRSLPNVAFETVPTLV